MVSELLFAKLLEILTAGSLEIGKFLQKLLVSIFRKKTAHVLDETEFSLQQRKG